MYDIILELNYYILKIKLLVCTVHPTYVEQQPMKIEQYITKSPICLKLYFRQVPFQDFSFCIIICYIAKTISNF